MSDSMRSVDSNTNHITPLPAVLALTVMASVGTGVIWNGVAFIAKHRYDFSEERSLWLYFVMGVTYVLGAFAAGRVTKLVMRRLSHRRLMAVILLAQSAVCFGPLFVGFG